MQRWNIPKRCRASSGDEQHAVLSGDLTNLRSYLGPAQVQGYESHVEVVASGFVACCEPWACAADKRQREEKRQREREEAELIWEQGRSTWQQRLLEDVRLEVRLWAW